MKKYIAIFALLATVAACSKDNAKENVPSGEGGNTVRKTLTVNIASFEAPAPAAAVEEGEGETRVSLGAEAESKMPLLWSTGDRIAVIQDKGLGSQKISIYELEGAGGNATGTFAYVSGDASDADADIKDVIYPASAAASYAIPTAQNYTAGNVDKDAVLMTWHSDTGIGPGGITFSPAGAIVCLQMTGISTLQVASITANVNSTDYTLTCASPVTPLGDAVPFYIALPPCSDQTVEFTVNLKYGAVDKTVKKVTFGKTFMAGKVHRFPACDVIACGDYIDGGIVFMNYLSTVAPGDSKSNFVKIMSLDEGSGLAFSTEEVDLSTVVESNYSRDRGKTNTALITGTANYSASTYPGPAWCVNHGEGWYVPGDRDVLRIYNTLVMSSFDEHSIGSTRAQGIIERFGGTMVHYSSTKGNRDCMYVSSSENATQRQKIRTRGFEPDKGVASYSKATTEKVYYRAVKNLIFE